MAMRFIISFEFYAEFKTCAEKGTGHHAAYFVQCMLFLKAMHAERLTTHAMLLGRKENINGRKPFARTT